jgi:hydroxymethylpyrimidine/phosphomethylpyrimidine kinase
MASAITSGLAKGLDVPEAVAAGKRFIERCVVESYPLGGGVGPVSPFWRLAP